MKLKLFKNDNYNIAFFTTIFVGLITHIFPMVNPIFNDDSIKSRNYGMNSGGAQLGRWLAEIINIDQRNLSNIECGNTFPTKSLLKISKVLNVSLPELFDFDYIPKNIDEMKNFIVKNIENMNDKDIITIYRMVKVMQ